MKRIMFIVLFLGITRLAIAGQTEERKEFFFYTDPSTTMAYSGATSGNATGDEVVCNTYTQKTIQVYSMNVEEYVVVQVEGKSKDASNYSILNSIEFGGASSDIVRNGVIDIPQHIDFLRVGIISWGTNAAGTDGTSRIDVNGIFTNLER